MLGNFRIIRIIRVFRVFSDYPEFPEFPVYYHNKKKRYEKTDCCICRGCYVGLGFDLVDFLDDFGTDPSISYTVKGFENISHAQQLLAEIRSLGFSEQEMAQLCSGNFLRVIKETIA